MTLTEQERMRAMKLFRSRQECNKRYKEKASSMKTENHMPRGSKMVDEPTDEQLVRILKKTEEKYEKKRQRLYPKTLEEIQNAIDRLALKAMITYKITDTHVCYYYL